MSEDVDLGMVCTCTAGGRAEAEAEARTERVSLRLGVADGLLVTAVLSSLMQAHSVASVEVFADQWFALAATLRDGRRVLVSADEVEHGVARVWEWVVQQRVEP